MQSDLLHTVKVSVSRDPHWPPAHCCSIYHLPGSYSHEMLLTFVFIYYWLDWESAHRISKKICFVFSKFSVAFDRTFANGPTCCSVSPDHLVDDARWELPMPPKPLSSSPQLPVWCSAPPQPPLKTKTRMRRDPRSRTHFLYHADNFFACHSFVNICAAFLLKMNTDSPDKLLKISRSESENCPLKKNLFPDL